MKCLNLGCGLDIRDSKDNVKWINYDLSPPCTVVGTWLDGLPFKESIFDLVYASHVLEHVKELQPLKDEICRVMRPGGRLDVVVPNYLSPDAWGEPTHYRAFSLCSFAPMFWPGFTLISIKRKDIKGFGKEYEKAEWILACLQRDYQKYESIKFMYDPNYTNKCVSSA